MTKFSLVIFSFLSLFIISCSDDDDNTENSIICDVLSGFCDNKWELIRVEGGIAGINDTVEKGDVEWEVRWHYLGSRSEWYLRSTLLWT